MLRLTVLPELEIDLNLLFRGINSSEEFPVAAIKKAMPPQEDIT